MKHFYIFIHFPIILEMIFFNLTNDIFQRGWAWTCLNHHHRPTVSRSSSSHSSSFLNSHSFPAPYSTSGSRYRLIFTKDDQFFCESFIGSFLSHIQMQKRHWLRNETWQNPTKPHCKIHDTAWNGFCGPIASTVEEDRGWWDGGLSKQRKHLKHPPGKSQQHDASILLASISQWKTLQVGSRYHSALTIGTWNHLNLCACAFTALSTQQNKTMRSLSLYRI